MLPLVLGVVRRRDAQQATHPPELRGLPCGAQAVGPAPREAAFELSVAALVPPPSRRGARGPCPTHCGPAHLPGLVILVPVAMTVTTAVPTVLLLSVTLIVFVFVLFAL